MKIPKYKYIKCVGRCPKQVGCFHVASPKEYSKCTLTFHMHLRPPINNLIKILEIENE